MAKNIGIASDLPLIRESIQNCLSFKTDLGAIAFSLGTEAFLTLAETETHDLDILILHCTGDAHKYTKKIKELKRLNKRVFMLLDNGQGSVIEELCRMNVDAIVSLHEATSLLVLLVLERLESGNNYLSEAFKEEVFKSLRYGEDKKLTRKEYQIVDMLGRGHSTQEIASLLHCSPKTVNVHRANIKNKLGISTNYQFIRYCINKVN